MGAVYKDKKGSSCKMCKPHKNGWTRKKKARVFVKEKVMQREITELRTSENPYDCY